MQSGERLLNHTHGPFDLLHFENINFLEAASLFYLISTIHVTISYSLISNIKMLSPGIPNSVIMPSIDRR